MTETALVQEDLFALQTTLELPELRYGPVTSATQTGNSLSFTYDALSRNLAQVGPQ